MGASGGSFCLSVRLYVPAAVCLGGSLSPDCSLSVLQSVCAAFAVGLERLWLSFRWVPPVGLCKRMYKMQPVCSNTIWLQCTYATMTFAEEG